MVQLIFGQGRVKIDSFGTVNPTTQLPVEIVQFVGVDEVLVDSPGVIEDLAKTKDAKALTPTIQLVFESSAALELVIARLQEMRAHLTSGRPQSAQGEKN